MLVYRLPFFFLIDSPTPDIYPLPHHILFFFFFNDTATTEIYPLSLHDALPISVVFRVVDKNNQPVSGITPADIQIDDQGISRTITSFRANVGNAQAVILTDVSGSMTSVRMRSEEHTSELQSRLHLVCRLLLEKK